MFTKAKKQNVNKRIVGDSRGISTIELVATCLNEELKKMGAFNLSSRVRASFESRV